MICVRMNVVSHDSLRKILIKRIHLVQYYVDLIDTCKNLQSYKDLDK